jgi:hypothetical protein
MRESFRRAALRRLAGLLAVPALFAGLRSLAAQPAPLAIKGYDSVAYFTLGRPTRGRVELEHEWDGRRYLFASARHRELFRADPLRYVPQFPDFCAMALTRGELHQANPEHWLISEGKLYMFEFGYGPERFQQKLAENVKRANDNRNLLPRP